MSKRKDSKKKKNKNNKKSKKYEDLNYYIFIDDGYELPPWFNRWKDGFIKIPFNEVIYETKNGDEFGIYNFNKRIGEDQNYIATLSKIIFSTHLTRKNNFVIGFDVELLVKPSRKKYVPDPLKEFKAEYEILCPIWQ